MRLIAVAPRVRPTRSRVPQAFIRFVRSGHTVVMSARALPRLIVLSLVALIVAGCLDNDGGDEPDDTTTPSVDYTHLEADGATVTDTETGSRVFAFEGIIGPGASAPLVGSLPESDEVVLPFDIDASVGYVEARWAGTGEDLAFLDVLDHDGRLSCRVGARSACTAPVSDTITGTETFALRLVAREPQNVEGAFHVEVELLPAHLIPYGDVPSLDPAFSFRLSDTGHDGGEPTLGVLSDGTIFDIVGTTTLRSTDRGESWQDTTAPITTTTLDPMLHVDPYNDRVFVNHLYVACSYLSWSDDAGETWITNPAACGNTAIDHQKLAVGGALGPGVPYDGVVYFSYNSFALLVDGAAHQVVSRSLDGGATWQPAVAVAESLDYAYRTGGPIAADRDGNVYIPMYLLDGGFGVAASNDHGLTWNAVVAGAHSGAGEGIDPGLAIDTAGNAYGAYWGEGAVRVVASTDLGATWSDEVIVSPPELQSFVLVDAVAGDEGRVAVAYLATADSPHGPNEADGFARWHLYLSMTENALADPPVWRTARVTPADDPVQIGSICTGGIGCAGGNRNLLDFIDIQPGPEGWIHIAYTDGCLPDPGAVCDTPPTSRENRGYVAIQTDGPRLFVDRAPWA